jgi:hypothetical protein
MKPPLEPIVQWLLENGIDNAEVQEILLYGSGDEIARLNMSLSIAKWRIKRDTQ